MADKRKVNRYLRKIRKSKNAGEVLQILAKLQREDPETYRALKDAK